MNKNNAVKNKYSLCKSDFTETLYAALLCIWIAAFGYLFSRVLNDLPQEGFTEILMVLSVIMTSSCLLACFFAEAVETASFYR